MTDYIPDFLDACQEIDRLGLSLCSSGNLSFRAAEDMALITGTGTWFGKMSPEKISISRISDQELINNVKPSVESRFHLGILNDQPEINAVLHFQSPYATAIACGKTLPDNFNVILEVPFYIGDPIMVDFLPPGSEELANAVREASCKSAMVIIQNHGMVTTGKSLSDVIQKAAFFELACSVLVKQGNPSFISQEMVARLVTA